MCLLSYDFLKKLIIKYKYKYNVIEIKKKDKITQTKYNDIEDYDIINIKIIDNYSNVNKII
jgi:hypothetical protein